MSGLPDNSPPQGYVLRLYITGNTPRSLRAIANLRQILADQAIESYDLEVIDIYQQPGAAAEHQIIAAPTLVKLSPAPVRRIIGDLSDDRRVLKGLEIEPAPGKVDDEQPSRT